MYRQPFKFFDGKASVLIENKSMKNDNTCGTSSMCPMKKIIPNPHMWHERWPVL